MKRLCAVLLLIAVDVCATGAPELTLPNKPASLKCAVIGDSGTGELPEYDGTGTVVDSGVLHRQPGT
jgi:hypothetical protein